jgi:hypothetical protein
MCIKLYLGRSDMLWLIGPIRLDVLTRMILA